MKSKESIIHVINILTSGIEIFILQNFLYDNSDEMFSLFGVARDAAPQSTHLGMDGSGRCALGNCCKRRERERVKAASEGGRVRRDEQMF